MSVLKYRKSDGSIGTLGTPVSSYVTSVNGKTGAVTGLYDSNNPPPYPVTSVNGRTGAVTIDVPKLAALTYDAPYNSDQSAWEIPLSAFTNPADTSNGYNLVFIAQAITATSALITDFFISGSNLYIRAYNSSYEKWGTGETIHIIYRTA